MPECTTFKDRLTALRQTVDALRALVPHVEAELHPPGQRLRGLSNLQQARMDPHRNIANPRSLTEWVQTLENAATSLEMMSSRWP